MILVLSSLVLGCPGTSGPESQQDIAAPPAAPKAEPRNEEDEGPPEGLLRHLQALKNKQSCNRVMGCEPAIGLSHYGQKAASVLLGELEAGPVDGRYWQVMAIKLLGALEAQDALPLLHTLLEQPRWEVRTRAALAIAAIAQPESEGALRSLLTRQHDLASDAAAIYGLHALGASLDGMPARDVLVSRLPTEFDALSSLNPGHFAFLAELVGLAQLRPSLQLARWGAIHKDRFTRMAALQTLALLKDREGIPYAITRLEDVSPGVKRQALRTLRLITGRTAFTKAHHWRDWCEQRNCLKSLREAQSSALSKGAVKPRGEDSGRSDVRRDEDQLNQGQGREQGSASTKRKD